MDAEDRHRRRMQRLIDAELALQKTAEAYSNREHPLAEDDLYEAAREYTDAWRADQQPPPRDG